MESHDKVCPLKPVKCPNVGCALKVEQRDFKKHTEKLCDYRTEYCKLCTEPYIFANKKKHFTDATKSGLHVLYCFFLFILIYFRFSKKYKKIKK